MKYLLTLLLLCPLAHASDAARDLTVAQPSPLRRPGTPLLSRSLSVMPSINQVNNMNLGHHRNRSKSHINDETTSSGESTCSSSVPSISQVPSTPTRSTSMQTVLRHPMGIHRSGIIPSHITPEQPDTDIIQENFIAPETARLQEFEQLRKDKTELTLKLENLRLKQHTSEKIWEAQESIARSAAALGSIAVDIAGFEEGDTLTELRGLEAINKKLIAQNEEIISQNSELLTKITATFELVQQLVTQQAAATSKERKPMSARLGELSTLFSSSKNLPRPDSTRS